MITGVSIRNDRGKPYLEKTGLGEMLQAPAEQRLKPFFCFLYCTLT
jgi:hypothetical protein